MKKINSQQIEAILQTVYNTNIPAKTFDSLKKMLLELPDIKEKVAPKTKSMVK
jgi:hypothetical protein